jgi:hypothetical protein
MSEVARNHMTGNARRTNPPKMYIQRGITASPDGNVQTVFVRPFTIRVIPDAVSRNIARNTIPIILPCIVPPNVADESGLSQR